MQIHATSVMFSQSTLYEMALEIDALQQENLVLCKMQLTPSRGKHSCKGMK